MTLRQKLALCFGGLLLVIGAMGVHSILRFRDLGRATDTVLRENYESIVACREMDASLSQLDRGALLISLGRPMEGDSILSAAEGDFEKGLRREMRIITLPGEGVAA